MLVTQYDCIVHLVIVRQNSLNTDEKYMINDSFLLGFLEKSLRQDAP